METYIKAGELVNFAGSLALIPRAGTGTNFVCLLVTITNTAVRVDPTNKNLKNVCSGESPRPVLPGGGGVVPGTGLAVSIVLL